MTKQDEIQECRERQAHYLEEYEKENISAMERDAMMHLFYERLVELEKNKELHA